MNNRRTVSRRTRALLPMLLAPIVALCIVPHADAKVDLGRKYRARLESEKWRRGHDWTAEEDDVWTLKAFSFAYQDLLRIALGPSNVVFGKSDTSVLWAAVIPETPGDIVAAPAGKGEAVTSVFLRFHPALVGKLFHPAAVVENGPPRALVAARRLYQHKIDGSPWEIDGMPRVPKRSNIIVDCETAGGKRRVYSVDTSKRAVIEDTSLLDKPVPTIAFGPLDGAKNQDVFDQAWEAFDRYYPCFTLKPKLDWQELRKHYRELAKQARDRYELAGTIAIMLGRLDDLDIAVSIEKEPVWCYERARFRNANASGTEALVGKLNNPREVLRWQRTRDNVGYVFLINVLHKDLTKKFDRALDELRGTRGLIIDLRYNVGSGKLELAKSLAGRFTKSELVYGFEQIRAGARREHLDEKKELIVTPRGPWTWEKPVAVLCGQRTMGAAESLAAMIAATPKARTVGDHTAGAVTTTRLVELPGKITMALPLTLVLDSRERPIHGVGLRPDVPVSAPISKYTTSSDPVVRAALSFLKRGR